MSLKTTTNPPELSSEGGFQAIDESVDLTIYHVEDWLSFVFFWALAFTVFYQFFTRYALNNSASWTEEIARYLLICVVFIGAVIGVRKNTHIQVDILYRWMPNKLARVLSILVDLTRIGFCGYATFLTYQLMKKIGHQQMAIIDWPIGLIYGVVMLGFLCMCARATLVGYRHFKQGYSLLERPQSHIDGSQ